MFLRKFHLSSFVFFALVVVVLLLLNLPGQIVLEPNIFREGKYGPHFEVDEYCEHGWPLVYMRREAVMLEESPYWRLSLWNVFEGVEWFKVNFLIADIVIGVIMAGASVCLFERWRRRRERLLQFYVSDLLLLTVFVAIGTAVFVFYRSQHATEQKALQAIDDSGNPLVDWQKGGPSWLRNLFGDGLFECFDYVVGIDLHGVDLSHAEKLRHLRVVRIYTLRSTRELSVLEQLPQLVALDMCSCSAGFDLDGHQVVDEYGNAVRPYITLPRLPQLRGLNLNGAAFRGDGLENIPGIEMLDLSETDVDDDSIPALIELSELKVLKLWGTGISDAGVARLRKALPECNVQWYDDD